jgi:hypothetical protein
VAFFISKGEAGAGEGNPPEATRRRTAGRHPEDYWINEIVMDSEE